MRILFVTGEYPPMVGGVGAYTAALAQALVGAGTEAFVLTSVQAQTAEKGRVPVLPVVQRWNLAAWRAIAREAQAMAADWVHVQYQTAAFGMNPTLNLAARPRAPFNLAWTYHDLLPPYLFPKAGSVLRNWVTEQPTRNADLVIVTNAGDRQQLVGRADNVHTIPIGSNIAGVRLDAPARHALRAQYGYGEGELVLGYFGFLNRSKGGDTLIGALDLLVQQGSNAHLLMIGDRLGASDPSNAATLAEIEAMIAQRGLANRVRWTGRLDDEAASAALNVIDLLLLPYRDGASLRRGTLMAGLANGCAIVTTEPAHPLPELVDGRDLRYVPAGNAQALANAASVLATDAAQVQALRKAARTQSAHFTWQAIAQAHLELYAAAAARHASLR
jgi:glycosyltransferase involved in cell wall biosynthesis